MRVTLQACPFPLELDVRMLGTCFWHFPGCYSLSLQGSDSPVEENKLFLEPNFLGNVFNRLDTVRKYFLSKGTQEQSGGAQNPWAVSLCGCRTPHPRASCPGRCLM